jgi:hypothetical protein
MQAQLCVIGGKADKTMITLELPTTVGRSPHCGLTIAHPMVSRQHCEIFEVDGLVMIRDLDSLNGVLIAGRRVKEAPLPPESEFTLGPLTFRIEYLYGGNLTKLPPFLFDEPDVEVPSIASEPETPDVPAAEEPDLLDDFSIDDESDQEEADEVAFDETPSATLATPDGSDVPKEEAAESVDDEELLDFLNVLRKEAATEESHEGKEPEPENAPALTPEPVASEQAIEATAAETLFMEALAAEPEISIEVSEEPAEESALAEPTAMEEPKVETPPSQESEDIFDFSAEFAIEDTPAELVTTEEVEAVLDATEEQPQDISHFFQELAAETPPAEPVMEGSPEIVFETSEEPEEPSIEVFPTEPAMAAESEGDIEAVEESEVEDLIEEVSFETSPTETEAIEEPEIESEAVEEAEMMEATEADAEMAEESEAEFDSEEEPIAEDEEEYPINPAASGPKALDASGFAMRKLASRGQKQRQSWLGGLFAKWKREPEEDRIQPPASAEPDDELPLEEEDMAEEEPIEAEDYFDESEEDSDDQAVKPPPDPVDDLLKEFM